MKAPKLFLKPLIFMFIVFGVIAVVTSMTFGSRLRQEMTREYDSKARTLARSVADSDIFTILGQDAGTVQARINQYLSIAAVSYVVVTDENGEMLAHTFIPDVPQEIRQLAADVPKAMNRDERVIREIHLGEEPFLHVTSPIMTGLAGYVHIGMNMTIISQNIHDALMEQQVIMLILFGGSILLD